MAGYQYAKVLHDNVEINGVLTQAIKLNGFVRVQYSLILAYNLGSPAPQFAVYFGDAINMVLHYQSPVLNDGSQLAVTFDLSAPEFWVVLSGLSAVNTVILYDRLDGVG